MKQVLTIMIGCFAFTSLYAISGVIRFNDIKLKKSIDSNSEGIGILKKNDVVELLERNTNKINSITFKNEYKYKVRTRQNAIGWIDGTNVFKYEGYSSTQFTTNICPAIASDWNNFQRNEDCSTTHRIILSVPSIWERLANGDTFYDYAGIKIADLPYLFVPPKLIFNFIPNIDFGLKVVKSDRINIKYYKCNKILCFSSDANTYVWYYYVYNEQIGCVLNFFRDDYQKEDDALFDKIVLSINIK